MRWVWWLHDEFEAPSLDRSMWAQVPIGEGVSVQQDGQLEFSVDPSATSGGDLAEQRLVTTCQFQADFDAKVDYELLDWPVGNGVMVGLGASIGSDKEFALWAILRQGRPPGGDTETYTSKVRVSHGSAETGDVEGSLRIARENGVLSTYYMSRHGWVRAASAYEPRYISLTLLVAAEPATFGHLPVRAAFDNFDATSDGTQYSIFCPVKWPPRKSVRSG